MFPTDLVDSEWESSDSLESSGSSSQDQLDQGWQDKQEKPGHNSRFGPVSENNVAMLQSTDIHKSEHIYSQTTAGEPSFRCFVCRKAFACWSDLCGHAVVHRHELADHEKGHKILRPYKCPTCPEAFRADHLLVAHNRRIHPGEKLFKCSTCPRAFCWNYQLTRHEILHTDEKPFKCPSCSRPFKVVSSDCS
ncbi:unnamed protein product [Ixodes pacificus]